MSVFVNQRMDLKYILMVNVLQEKYCAGQSWTDYINCSILKLEGTSRTKTFFPTLKAKGLIPLSFLPIKLNFKKISIFIPSYKVVVKSAIFSPLFPVLCNIESNLRIRKVWVLSPLLIYILPVSSF